MIKTQTVLPSAETLPFCLGIARLWSDQRAKGRWLADALHKAHRSANRGRSLKRYLLVSRDRATPNSNRFPDATCSIAAPSVL
jgi:hypothetical protein